MQMSTRSLKTMSTSSLFLTSSLLPVTPLFYSSTELLSMRTLVTTRKKKPMMNRSLIRLPKKMTISTKLLTGSRCATIPNLAPRTSFLTPSLLMKVAPETTMNSSELEKQILHQFRIACLPRD